MVRPHNTTQLKKEGNSGTWYNTGTTQMNLEDITLNEISQSQKDKYCMSLLI